jgi:hypothetical protein
MQCTSQHTFHLIIVSTFLIFLAHQNGLMVKMLQRLRFRWLENVSNEHLPYITKLPAMKHLPILPAPPHQYEH